MRYVAQNCLRPGQQLAVDLKLQGSRIFLRNKVILTSLLIERIKTIGFQGAYIDDDISKDLMVANVISEDLVSKAKTDIRCLYMDIEKGKKDSINGTMDTIQNVIRDIVEQIQRNSRTMVNIVDLRTFDDYTYSHSLNVSVLSVVIGTVLELDKKTMLELATAALVHDIGKIFVSKEIVNKPAKLDDNEYAEIKKHSEKGYQYLRQYNRLSAAAMSGVLEHHEHYSGAGYPKGLDGDNISLFGRIIGLADVYDALISDRPYRRALLPSDALEYIMSGYGKQFDPKVVEAFMRKVAPYPVGTCISLSNGISGIVVSNHEGFGLRPKIRVIEEGRPTQNFIDMHNDQYANLTITGILAI